MSRFSGVFFFLIFSGIAVFAQEGEKPEHELDRRGGFQDIKLNTDISGYEGLEERRVIDEELFPDSRLYIPRKGYYENIGKVKIHDLEVKTYKGKIYEIIVVTEKDPAIYQSLSRLFGEPAYNMTEKGYYWKTNDIRLYFKQGGRKKLQIEYFSYIIQRERKEEIRKSYTDVADDF